MCVHCGLHTHSQYSQIDGVATAKELAQRAVDLGMPAMGLTDHGVVAGHLDFAKELTKVGVKPVFGCELYHGLEFGDKKPKRDQAHLIAMAMTDEGLKNLWRLVDYSAQEPRFHHVGRVDWDGIEKFKDGLVLTSACVAGLVPQGLMKGNYDPLNRYLDIMGDDFYIEISTYPGDAMMMDKDLDAPILMSDVNKLLVQAAQERGIPIVYGDDGHYAFPDQYKYHDAYIAKNTGQDIYTPIEDRKMWHPEGAVMVKDEQTIREALSYLPDSVVQEALDNSALLGERANASLPEVRRHLPVFIPDESPWIDRGRFSDASEAFIGLVEEGIYAHYGEDPDQEVWDRVFKEMEVFLESGLEHYFLLDWDKVQFVKSEDIEMGPGRGSAAGCLVAYALGITDVDPLPYDLVFERFWNAGRADGFPDIDSDISKSRRGEVKEYLTKRWGHNRVRSIGTVSRMKPKAVVDLFYKALDLTFREKEDIKKIINGVTDLEILGVDQIGWDREIDPGKVNYVLEDVGEELSEFVKNSPGDRRKIIETALDYFRVLCSRVSNYGVHASGIVISDVDLDAELPCRFAGSKDQRIPVTQFPMDVVDKRQFIKLDVLGLRTLDVLEDWRKQMKKQGFNIPWSGLEWQNFDEELWDNLAEGFTAGIFQVEAGYAKRLAKDFKPRSISDLSIIVALNRPGPIRSGAPESFITRRRGGQDDLFDGRKIPQIADILENTYGWFLYQEQVIAYFRKIGYNLSDADAVRKILGKKQPEKLQALYDGTGEWKGKSYIKQASTVGIDKYTADIIWDKLEDFAKYSFNKAHSVCYGTIGFRCALAKYYGAPEMYMSCIRNVDQQKKAEYIPAYIGEARRKKIRVVPPDIRFSQSEVSVVDNDVMFGFSDVKGVGLDSSNFLVNLRDEVKIDVRTPDALFEQIELMSKEQSDENKRRNKEGLPVEKKKSAKQMLQANKITALVTAGAWDSLGYRSDLKLKTIQECEKEFLSVILTDTVDSAFDNHVDDIMDCDSYEDALQEYQVDCRWTLPGVVATIKEVVTKAKKEPMGIVTIEYDGSQIDFAVFPREWQSTRFLFRERTPGIFTIRQNDRGYNFESGYRLT